MSDGVERGRRVRTYVEFEAKRAGVSPSHCLFIVALVDHRVFTPSSTVVLLHCICNTVLTTLRVMDGMRWLVRRPSKFFSP